MKIVLERERSFKIHAREVKMVPRKCITAQIVESFGVRIKA
jgi:hypothetical protein